MRTFSVALLGTRGIPARYGGFETFAEELSARLAARGHAVTVFGRHPLLHRPRTPHEYRGAALASSPTIMHKYLETPLAALTSMCLLLGRRTHDIVLLCNAANSPFAWLLRARGYPLVVNVDGIERRRAKWNRLGKLWYRLGELASVLFATRLVSDAEVIRDYYRSVYRRDSSVIRYGASPAPLEPGPVLSRYGLTPRGYLLYVSRLEPENNALGVVEAYVRSNVGEPLVVVGDAPYAQDYIARVKAAANERVVFTGYQFGESYRELQSNALLYVQATEVGGTHPALVEAMAYGNCVVANDTPEHREVLGDAGAYYPLNDFGRLAQLFAELTADAARIERFRVAARDRAAREFDWERITDQYEALFRECLKFRAPP